MNSLRHYLMIALLAVAPLGAYWAVSAQEGRPLFAPPAVVLTEEAKKAPVKYPFQTQPLREKAKADPTLIVPPEVYAEPRPTGPAIPLSEGRPGFVVEETSGVLQTEGRALPPLQALPKQEKDATPLTLPVLELKPLVVPMPAPMPIIEPTKALIIEPVTKDVQEKKTPPVEPVFPTPKSVIPPPRVEMLEPKATPILEPKTALPPPAISLPTALEPEPAPVVKPKSFVRIQPDAPPPIANPGPDSTRQLLEQIQRETAKKLPIPVATVGQSGLANLQTPSVTVEKRGASILRGGDAQSYQLVIRNLGPVPAQQIRIEDELPPNVKIISAEPTPQVLGNKVVWTLTNVNQEQILRLTLQANTDTELTGRVSVHVAAAHSTNSTSLRPRQDLGGMTIDVTGPNQVAVGKPAVFVVRVVNQSTQPLTGLVLHGVLPDGLVMRVRDEIGMRDEREIRGEVEGVTIAPGAVKTLEMPASAVKPGRWTVAVKVTTQAGHAASATASIDITAESGLPLQVQQAPTTRLFMGRDGDLRIDVTNHTAKLMRNITIADRLPEELDFVAASERGLFQANSRTVYWLIDQLPAGKTRTLVVRVNGAKAGQHSNVIFAKADGVAETQSTGVVSLDAVADLTLRVADRDQLIELGKENVYEIRVVNPGNAPASRVQVQVEFPPGLTPTSAQGDTRYTMNRQSIVFEPIPSLEPQREVILRVSARAESMGDQRVRFAVVSDQVRVPVMREISTRVVER